MPVGEVLALTAIDEVVVLGTPHAPRWHSASSPATMSGPSSATGGWSWPAMLAVGGVLVQFEMPDPTPCWVEN